ncbi:MAG: alanyl-tRNA editing protein [Oscillospiraceae bacterium]
MSTEKLYYENSYLADFSGVVTGCTQEKGRFAITLDRTAFYPEGGGQPCDIGYILVGENRVDIVEVREKQGEIYHYSDSPVPIGNAILGFIDFDRRFDLMQQHTGEHILSGLVKQEYGFDNVGFHLTPKDMSVDFSGALTPRDIEGLMEKANAIVLKNQSVTAEFPKNVETLSYRSKKELSGAIRIVTAGTADICACCGTHTATTGEVTCIAALDSMSYKGGTRIFMACGKRAFKDYMEKNQRCYGISHLLSSKVEEIVPAVEGKMAEVERLKQELYAMKNQLFSLWIKDIPSGKLGYFETEGLTPGELQKLAQLINEKCAIACAVARQGDGSRKVCIISTEFDTNILGRSVCEALSGKGGGKLGIFQCTVVKEGSIENIVNI